MRGDPGTRADPARLEDAFPFSGSCCTAPSSLTTLNIGDGTIKMVNGQRVWVANASWPTYKALVEINGHVYAARYGRASSSGWVDYYFNDTAKAAIVNAINGP